jgi:hypothetical protein
MGAAATLARLRGLSLAVSFRALLVTFFAVRAIAPPALFTIDFPLRGICFSFRDSQWLRKGEQCKREAEAVDW